MCLEKDTLAVRNSSMLMISKENGAGSKTCLRDQFQNGTVWFILGFSSSSYSAPPSSLFDVEKPFLRASHKMKFLISTKESKELQFRAVCCGQMRIKSIFGHEQHQPVWQHKYTAYKEKHTIHTVKMVVTH